MKCPYCESGSTLVIDSRKAGKLRRRRRICRNCDYKFTTTEAVGIIKHENLPLLQEFRIRKRSGSIASFDPEKLRRSLRMACKLSRVESEQIEDLVGRIRELVLGSAPEPVPVNKLVRWVTEELLAVDKIAGMRYAAMTVDEKDARKFKAAFLRAIK